VFKTFKTLAAEAAAFTPETMFAPFGFMKKTPCNPAPMRALEDV